MTGRIEYQYGHRTVQDLINLQENRSLNLEPGFQRKSVWNPSDRRKLIQSVLDGYPVPSIFLYRREEHGWPVYDVIDGKQRLETIFMFTGARAFRQQRFEVRHQFEDDDVGYDYDWRELGKWDLRGRLLGYSIQTVEVKGEFGDIVDLFVRINSTGKSLTTSEKRNARFYKSDFLREARKLAQRNRKTLVRDGVLTPAQIARMKDIELISELVASIAHGGLIHKKAAIDRAVGNEAMNRNTLKRACNEFTRVLRLTRQLFPDIRSTRFSNTSEFYSLFMVVWEMMQQHLVFTDKKRRDAANRLLCGFSNGVDRVRELQRKAKGPGPGQRLYVDYLMQAQQSTDNLIQRRRRAEILKGLFSGLFEKKDTRRLFSAEQRRLLWNSDEKKKCGSCSERLDWTNFHVDHIKPHSGGGRTELKNADILCVSCNTSKGAKRGRKKKAA